MAKILILALVVAARAVAAMSVEEAYSSIPHRRTVFDWNRDVPSSEGWCAGLFDPKKPGMHLGRKDTSDVSYGRS